MKSAMTPENPHRNRRILGVIILLIIAAIFVVFAGRFIYIAATGQVKGVDLTKRANQKYESATVIPASRGTIFDTNQNVLAEDTTVYSIYAVIDKNFIGTDHQKMYVTDKTKAAKVLSKYLPMSKKAIYKALTPDNPKAFQVEFGSAGKNLSLTIKNKIQAHQLSGIFFTEQPARLYPNGTFASHIVGLAQSDQSNDQANGKITGVMGIEKSFDTVLAGKDGYQKVDKDQYGYAIDSKGTDRPAKNGKNIHLTIDTRLQAYLENLMSDAYEKYKPKNLNAVLMNAQTGEILAASQRPTFNASTKKDIDKMWQNTLVEDAYEPGSVLKIATLASAIDSGNYNPDEYYASGSVLVGNRKIGDYNNQEGWGTIPLGQAFARSSNVGMVNLEQKMGAKTWQSYLKAFGFGQKTGIQLPGENKGSIQFDSQLDQAITSFGQGINVNAMQILQMTSAIANEGQMIQPQIIRQVGDEKTKLPKKVSQPIKASTAKIVLQNMQDTVEKDYGTGKPYQIPGYTVGVKTGTAQIASKTGGYLSGLDNLLYSVDGVIPADKPQYIMYITFKQPQSLTENPEKIIAEIFKPMMQRAMEYTNEDSDGIQKNVTVPDVMGKTTEKSQKVLNEKQLKPELIGSGNTVVQQLPQADHQLLPNQRVFLLTNGAMTMPDVTGWSKNDLMKLAQITGKTIKMSGEGYAYEQSLAANSYLDNAATVEVKLKK